MSDRYSQFHLPKVCCSPIYNIQGTPLQTLSLSLVHRDPSYPQFQKSTVDHGTDLPQIHGSYLTCSRGPKKIYPPPPKELWNLLCFKEALTTNAICFLNTKIWIGGGGSAFLSYQLAFNKILHWTYPFCKRWDTLVLAAETYICMCLKNPKLHIVSQDMHAGGDTWQMLK